MGGRYSSSLCRCEREKGPCISTSQKRKYGVKGLEGMRGREGGEVSGQKEMFKMKTTPGTPTHSRRECFNVGRTRKVFYCFCDSTGTANYSCPHNYQQTYSHHKRSQNTQQTHSHNMGTHNSQQTNSHNTGPHNYQQTPPKKKTPDKVQQVLLPSSHKARRSDSG